MPGWDATLAWVLSQQLTVPRVNTRTYHENFDSGFVAGDLDTQGAPAWAINVGSLNAFNTLIDATSKVGGVFSITPDAAGITGNTQTSDYNTALATPIPIGTSYRLLYGFEFGANVGFDNADQEAMFYLGDTADGAVVQVDFYVVVANDGKLRIYDNAAGVVAETLALAVSGTIAAPVKHTLLITYDGVTVNVYLDPASLLAPGVATLTGAVAPTGVIKTHLHHSFNVVDQFADLMTWFADGVAVETVGASSDVQTTTLFDGEISNPYNMPFRVVSYMGTGSGFDAASSVQIDATIDGTNFVGLANFIGSAGGVGAVLNLDSVANGIRFTVDLAAGDYNNDGVTLTGEERYA